MEAVPEVKFGEDEASIYFNCREMGFSCCLPVNRDIRIKYRSWVRGRLLPPLSPGCDFTDIYYDGYKVSLGIYWQSKTCILEFRSNGSNVKTLLHIKTHFQDLINIFAKVFY